MEYYSKSLEKSSELATRHGRHFLTIIILSIILTGLMLFILLGGFKSVVESKSILPPWNTIISIVIISIFSVLCLLLCFCIIYFFIKKPAGGKSWLLLVQRGEVKEFRNIRCQVYHRFKEENYSKEAEHRLKHDKTKSIFSFCGFSPKYIMNAICNKYYEQKNEIINTQDLNAWGDDRKSFIGAIKEKFGKNLFPHFQAFHNYARKHVFQIIRVLLLTGEKEYDGDLEDFKRYSWLNGKVPCFVVLKSALSQDCNLGDYAIFFENDKIKKIDITIEDILNSESKSDFILQYQGEAKILLASRFMPAYTFIDYYEFINDFLSGTLQVQSLHEYISEYFKTADVYKAWDDDTYLNIKKRLLESE